MALALSLLFFFTNKQKPTNSLETTSGLFAKNLGY
jgi:hypothetical protein